MTACFNPYRGFIEFDRASHAAGWAYQDISSVTAVALLGMTRICGVRNFRIVSMFVRVCADGGRVVNSKYAALG